MEFFKSTIISKFIKYLLYNTPTSLCPIIEHNDLMVEGVTYLKGTQILKCTKTGVFLESYSSLHPLYVDDDLLVTNSANGMKVLTGFSNGQQWVDDYLKVTNKFVAGSNINITAEFDVLGNYTLGHPYRGITENFISTAPYYDSHTHKYLGKYLRLLKTYYQLNLMPLYNCYANQEINEFKLINSKVQEVKDNNYKVLLVPIQFNQAYTIALDSSSKVNIYPVFYQNGLIKKGKDECITNDFLSSGNTFTFERMDFTSPVNVTIHNTEKKYFGFLNDLYLAIEVGSNNDNSLVVLEGTYSTSADTKIISADMLNVNDPQELDYALTSSCSLLELNDGIQHPFSDKLISYLLQHTVDTRTTNEYDIEKICNSLKTTPSYTDVWTNELRYLLFTEYMALPNKYNLNKKDILGFMDVDVENAIYKRYLSNA